MKQAPVQRIKRSQVNLTAYNPRTISEYAKSKLTESLQEFGLVETLVWNSRSGNLVSGHQRLAIMDAENGYPGNDYELDVSVVKLTKKQEKRLNVWLNNRAAQGSFDRDKFVELLAVPGEELLIEDMGLTMADLTLEFGPIDLPSPVHAEQKSAEEVKTEIEKLKRLRDEGRQRVLCAENQEADYYLMLVFPSNREKSNWLQSHGFQTGALYLTVAEAEAALGGKHP